MTDQYDAAVALIGMSGRFPGAQDVSAFWDNLMAGVKSIRHPGDAELRDAGVSPGLLADPAYVKACAPVADADAFDAAFFGIAPEEAEIIDPQHRLFLECSWAALEAAGYDPSSCPGSVGVFGGCCFPTYLLYNIITRPDVVAAHGPEQIAIATDRDSLASRVSYKLNLRGPSVAVQAFSATSLVAVHLATQSLLSFESDLALAGAAAIKFPQAAGYRYRRGSLVSPDGECRSLDSGANGTVIGNGVGVVVLKRLPDALRDGDHVHCVVLGSAVNSSGARRAGYTAPGRDGQVEVVAEAQAAAGVSAHDIGYVEAHGIGTALGDAVEIAALRRVFGDRPAAARRCVIGSFKPNTGHLEGASGVAALIRTAQILERGLLPPQVNFKEPGTGLDGVFEVNTQAREWAADGAPRRAGVSSFGIGGVNAHVVLEEPPARPARSGEQLAGPHLVVLSARSAAALDEATLRLRQYLERTPDAELADVAYTLQTGRRTFEHRRAILCADRADALAVLGDPGSGRVVTAAGAARGHRIAFLVPAGTAPVPPEALRPYADQPAYRAAMSECRAAGLREPASALAARYAVGRLLQHWGCVPEHASGPGRARPIAECLASRLSLAQALSSAGPGADGGTWTGAAGAADEDASAARALLGDERYIVLELGDGRLIRSLTGELAGRHLPLLADPGRLPPCGPAGALWLAGVRLDWPALHAGLERRRVPLPTYPFAKTRHWLTPGGPPVPAERKD